jgi:hypothetical protein
MNPTLAAILSKNSTDLEAIVAKIGIGTLLSLTPHLLAILATVDAQKAASAAPK